MSKAIDKHGSPVTLPLAIAREMADAMAEAGIRYVCVLPETWLAALYQVLSEDTRFTVVPLAKEEEGVGILAGSYFAGSPGALLMSNSGFMTCMCALNGLAMRSGIPMLLMVVQRGDLQETQVLQGNIAQPTIGILDALGISHHTMSSKEEISLIGECLRLSIVLREPVALLLEKRALLGSTGSVYWYRDENPMDSDARGGAA